MNTEALSWASGAALVLLCVSCKLPVLDNGELDPARDAAAAGDLQSIPDLAVPRDLRPIALDLSGCKTTCGGAECGPIPDGCGGTIRCGDCGDSTFNCITYPSPLFQGTVHKAIELVKMQHPEYFDLHDTKGGGSVKVLDKMGFVTALAAAVSATGVVAIVDPNDNNEIRVRAAGSDSAENYHVITSASYSWDHYTSTCTPAGF